MSTENILIEQHLTFVNKMRERVRGTDLEPIWERLYAYMTKINDLPEDKKIAIDAMIKKMIAKIEHFKNISEQRLDAINTENKSDHEIDAQFETSPAPDISSLSVHSSTSQPEQPSKDAHEFIKPKQKVKKFKRIRMARKDYPHIVMSPRGDNIPVMRIRLSEIHNKKRQKEAKKKSKKIKDVDVLKAAIDQYERSKQLPISEPIIQIEKNVETVQEIQPEIEHESVVEKVIQNHQNNNIPMEVEKAGEISSVHNTTVENRLSILGLKECTVRIIKCTPEKKKNISETIEFQPELPSTSETANFSNPSITVPKKSTELKKIPIEKSKSVIQQNGSKKIDDQESIYIVDSDDEDNMHIQISTTAVEDINAQKVTPKGITRSRKKSLYREPSVISKKETEQPVTPQKSSKALNKSPKTIKYQPSPQSKKQKLEDKDSQQNSDDSCIVTLKTVDLTVKPQEVTGNPTTSPVTPQTSSKSAELLKNVNKSAPVAKLQGPKRNRNSIDTLPILRMISQTSEKTAIRQSVRQATRRNSVAVAFEPQLPAKQKITPEKSSNFIKIISVDSIPSSTSMLKMLDSQQIMPTKKLQNARKSTQSNQILLNRELASCNQTTNNNNMNQVTALYDDILELISYEPTQIPQNIPSEFKNEPKSPVGYMTPPMTEIPTCVMLLEAQKDKKLVLLSSAATLNKIRPWLKTSEHRKLLKNCENMLANGFCLSALFKCMGSTCSYYTNNSTLFIRHLKIHQQKQANDMKYFSQCAYCSTIDDNPEALVQHIIDKHGYSRYQCAYCFYRSCDFHIHTHHKLFHPLKSEVIIECKPLRTLDIEKEFENALSNVMSVCKPVFCCVCKFKFYNIKNFENHYKAYPSVPSSRCLHCKFEITQASIMDHLKECHKFGDYNCAFCSFASDSSDSIKIHLSNQHYDKPMLYYDRTKQSHNVDLKAKGSTNKEDVLKSVVLKKLIHQEQMNAKKIKIFNDQNELENVHNINTGLLEK
ncbi:hypothetical protein ACKWTF_005552 [Chironomus riparius]